jgi:hypothetical protein
LFKPREQPYLTFERRKSMIPIRSYLIDFWGDSFKFFLWLTTWKTRQDFFISTPYGAFLSKSTTTTTATLQASKPYWG